MDSLRMCAVCRKMKLKEQLFRIVRVNDAFFVDHSSKLQGRGAYICKDEQCVNKAEKCRALERSFSGKVDGNIYKALEELIHDAK